ncbi:hypothetical protein Tco_1351129 [Tanacetum coccineum]
MNPHETQQVAVRDEKWVPFTERVKIRSTNAFTISANVLKIFLQQFWYSIKKVQGIDSYEFILANKKCVVNDDVFKMILDICQRVEGVNFTDVLDDDTTLAFLIKLGYKENVDYPELIWEDLAFQIDHIKEKISRRENMPFPQFTKIIINHFLKKHKSLSNLKYQHYHTIKDDGIEIVDVIEESKHEPEPVKRKTASRRVVKKKVTISADDKIISNDPDAALELGKSMSLTESEEAGSASKSMLLMQGL